MPTPLNAKSTVAEIRQRFDNDVQRYSNLETGQAATVDAPLVMTMITQAAVASTPQIRRVLDIGCGAGNNTLKLLESLGKGFDADLLDLSQPMLERALARVAAVNDAATTMINADIRNADLTLSNYDVILAAAVLHHLRDEDDWQAVFQKMYSLLVPGGTVWITDLVSHEIETVQSMMWDRWGEYLIELDGSEYRDEVFDYIDKEDSPRPVTYQLDLLRQVGFEHVDLLHKNSCFAAFGAKKPG